MTGRKKNAAISVKINKQKTKIYKKTMCEKKNKTA